MSDKRKITIKCPNCHKSYPVNKFEVDTEVDKIQRECVYSDSGYGDDDRYADILYLTINIECPLCGYAKRSIRGVRMGEVGRYWDYDTED